MRLDDALRIPGAYAVALIAADGPALTWWGRSPNEEQARAAAGIGRSAADLVRLGSADQQADALDDVLITSANAFHVLRLLPGEGAAGGPVAHLMLRRAGANLAMARHDFRSLTAAYAASVAVAPAPAPAPSVEETAVPDAPGLDDVEAALGIAEALDPGPRHAMADDDPVTDEPAEAAVADEPAEAAVADEPAVDAPMDEPAADVDAGEPLADISAAPGEQTDTSPDKPELALRTDEKPAPGLEPEAPEGEDRGAKPQEDPVPVLDEEPAPESEEGKKPLLPRREPKTNQIPAAVETTATSAAWLDLLGQPFLADETILERVLGSLKQL